MEIKRKYPNPRKGPSCWFVLFAFVVIFGGVGVGLLVGFLWEWIREHRQRAEAAAQRREMDRMRREIKRLKADKHEGKDDVLAILDEAS